VGRSPAFVVGVSRFDVDPRRFEPFARVVSSLDGRHRLKMADLSKGVPLRRDGVPGIPILVTATTAVRHCPADRDGEDVISSQVLNILLLLSCNCDETVHPSP